MKRTWRGRVDYTIGASQGKEGHDKKKKRSPLFRHPERNSVKKEENSLFLEKKKKDHPKGERERERTSGLSRKKRGEKKGQKMKKKKRGKGRWYSPLPLHDRKKGKN